MADDNHSSVSGFRCICELCDTEVKMFDQDLKLSLEIHNSTELHKIVAKSKELNQNSKLGLETKPLLDLNNVPNELMKVSLNDVASVKDKDLVFQQNHFSQSITPKSYLGEKKSNLNLNQKTENQGSLTTPLPFSWPGGQFATPPPPIPLPGWGQHMQQPPIPPLLLPGQFPKGQKVPKGTQNISRRKNEQQKKPPTVEVTCSQQPINIHVHMQTPSEPRPSTEEPKTQAPKQTNKSLFNIENFQKLQSRELNHRAEFQLVYQMVREVEGSYWIKNNFTKNGHEYTCNVCNYVMNSSYDFVMHVRGKQHLDKLRSTTVFQPQPQPQHRNQKQTPVAQHDNRPVRREQVVAAPVDERAEMSRMWREIKKAEGDKWSRGHISKDGDRFQCNLCNTSLNSPYQLLEHVQGNAHQRMLDDEEVPRYRKRRESKDECVVM